MQGGLELRAVVPSDVPAQRGGHKKIWMGANTGRTAGRDTAVLRGERMRAEQMVQEMKKRALPIQTVRFIETANLQDPRHRRAIEQLYRKYVTMDYRQALEKERTV